MKTKFFTGLASFLLLGMLSASAGGHFAVGNRGIFISSGGFCNRVPVCAPVRSVCYPVGYCYPNYCSVGPTMVYYSSCPATSVSSVFTNGPTVSSVSPVVPPPVFVTQPVVVQPVRFGWTR